MRSIHSYGEVCGSGEDGRDGQIDAKSAHGRQVDENSAAAMDLNTPALAANCCTIEELACQ